MGLTTDLLTVRRPTHCTTPPLLARTKSSLKIPGFNSKVVLLEELVYNTKLCVHGSSLACFWALANVYKLLNFHHITKSMN